MHYYFLFKIKKKFFLQIFFCNFLPQVASSEVFNFEGVCLFVNFPTYAASIVIHYLLHLVVIVNWKVGKACFANLFTALE